MERREFLKLPAAAALQAGAGREKPNILWLCTDQQRHDTLGVTGNARIRTPNMDRLARQGVVFGNAYCQNPVCTPSRASFMTGCYPDTLHVHRNGNAWFPKELEPRLISRILAANGYDCGLVGKLHLSAAEGRVERRFDDGYRLFEWSHHPHPQEYWPVEKHAYQAWLRNQGVVWEKTYMATKVPVCTPE
jgi:arylsulfatase A-like enzyme